MRTTHPTASEVDAFIQLHMEQNRIPGIAACVVRNGRIAWEGYYGLANISRNDSVGPQTLFMLASVSKTVMVTALMQLWEDGRFSLDDDINAYLPFSVRNPFFPDIPITFRQLLCHVSSIRDTWSLMPYFRGDTPLSLGWYLEQYLTPGGEYYATTSFAQTAPGTQIAYSNVGAALSGYLIESITGIGFDRYCHDSLFTPLGMDQAAWFLRDLDTSLIARPYTWNGSYRDNGLYGYTDYPAGSLRTTIRSLGRFLGAITGWGTIDGARILDSATVRYMHSTQFPELDPDQGLIWYRFAYGDRILIGHAGGDAGVRTHMYFDESSRNGVIVLTNFSPASSDPVVGILLAYADTMTVNIQADPGNGKLPAGFELGQNYPNPFNPSTTIRFDVPAPAFVELEVYDLIGRIIRHLTSGDLQPATYSATWDGTDNSGNAVAGGVYYVRMTAMPLLRSSRSNVFTATTRIVLLR